MKKTVAKHIFGCLCCVVAIAISIAIFVMAIVPGFTKDRKQLVEDEMLVHNQTLDFIIEDFACVLTFDNVNVDIDNNNVQLSILGEVCDLQVGLNKDLKVTSLNTVDKTENVIAGMMFACLILAVLAITAICLFCKNINNIVATVKENGSKKKVQSSAQELVV